MREKLIELLYDIQRCGEDYTDYEIYGMRVPDTVSNEDVADHLIANGVTVQEWISVKDRLPENNTRVVVCYNNPIDGEKTVSSDVFWKGHWVRFGETVTHWMPLPPAPEENK